MGRKGGWTPHHSILSSKGLSDVSGKGGSPEQEAGKAIPVLYTEANFSTCHQYKKKETIYLLG